MKIITIPRILIGLFIMLIGFIAFLLLVPVEPLKINDVTINGNSFKAGGEMSFVIDRCKSVSSSVPGTSSRYFVDANDDTKADIFISSTDDLGEKGCAKVKRTMDIPSHIKDGTYRLKFVTRYYPSVLREPVKVEYETEQTFTVKGQEVSVQLQNIYEQLKNIQLSQNVQSTASGNETSNALPIIMTKPVDTSPAGQPGTSGQEQQQTDQNQNVQPGTPSATNNQSIIKSTLDVITNLLDGIL